MKTCRSCKESKSLDVFRVSGTKTMTICKPCESQRTAIWRKANPDKVAKYTEKYKESSQEVANEKYHTDSEYRETVLSSRRTAYRANPYKKLIAGARRRSELNNLPFDLCEEDLDIPTHCPVFGTLLEISSGQPSDNSPSLDRIIPELGYVKGNVMILSNLANRMKNSATPEQLATFANWILNDKSRFVTAPDN